MKDKLSIEEIKSLLLAKSDFLQKQASERENRISGWMDTPSTEENSAFAQKVKETIGEKLIGLMATRLKNDDRTIPLVSLEDTNDLIQPIMEALEKFMGEKLEEEDKETLEFTVRTIFAVLIGEARLPTDPKIDIYEEHWKWLDLITDIAEEQNTPAIELATINGTYDEITRRMFTRKQYLHVCEDRIKGMVNPQVLREKIYEPYLELLSDDDEEARAELRRSLDEEIMPELEKELQKIHEDGRKYLLEEADRIYGEQKE